MIQKVTHWMNFDGDSMEINVLMLLNEFADANPSFKNEFLDSCDRQMRKTGYLSGNQINCLIDIFHENCPQDYPESNADESE